MPLNVLIRDRPASSRPGPAAGHARGDVRLCRRTDAARLVRLGLETAPAGTRLHAVAEEAVSTRAIAEAIGRALGLPVVSVAPENAVEHFGFVGHFFAMDMSASSTRTRELLPWTPSGPTLVEDIQAGAYAEA